MKGAPLPARMGLVLCLLPIACASTGTVEDSARELASDLVDGLAQRSDLRQMRIYVAEFQPCDPEGESFLRSRDPSMTARHRGTARLLRHEVIGALASRVNVLDSPPAEDRPGETFAGEVFATAEALEANAVLFGNFAMEGDELLIMLRLVSVPDHTVLVAVENRAPHLEGMGG